MRKKREFHSSELVKSLAKIYGFNDVLDSFKVKEYLKTYLDDLFFDEIEKIQIQDSVLILKIKSPLLKNDFKMRKSFYLKKIVEATEISNITDIQII